MSPVTRESRWLDVSVEKSLSQLGFCAVDPLQQLPEQSQSNRVEGFQLHRQNNWTARLTLSERAASDGSGGEHSAVAGRIAGGFHNRARTKTPALTFSDCEEIRGFTSQMKDEKIQTWGGGLFGFFKVRHESCSGAWCGAAAQIIPLTVNYQW